jgi:hypothetical protein
VFWDTNDPEIAVLPLIVPVVEPDSLTVWLISTEESAGFFFAVTPTIMAITINMKIPSAAHRVVLLLFIRVRFHYLVNISTPLVYS